MNRILSIAVFTFLLILSGIHPLHAQSDSNAKKQIHANAVDSEKNLILTHQSEEFQSATAEQMGDSLRLLQLKYELLQLGANDQLKKQTLATERDQIKIKDSLRKILQKLKIDSLRSVVSGFPVILSQDTLFYVFTKLGSYSPRERARVVSGRIEKLAEEYFYSEDSLVITASELTTDVGYGEETIISVSELDALWMNSTKEKLAQEYRFTIAKSIKAYKIQNSWQSIMKEILLAV